ncbi:subtilase [Bacteriovorax stolpii]|uniref:Subtilase n=1 Tax=Bacteriovorax stolpii TaxID=960 RepID=A0A2K9NV67_BACTC|nr:S8 family serine peptidase [Bacteriovorax stolpii]AUN98965.1 subtilase [Bacteriovorax stolpii]TDP55512.1 CUB-like protein [Bacteriovorax stolpii]
MKKMLLGLSTLALATGVSATEAKHVPGEIVVKFKAGKSKNFLSAKTLSSLGIQGQRDIKLSYDTLSVLKVSADKSMESVIATLKNNPNVEFAEPNFIYSVNPIKEENVVSKKLLKSPFTDFTAATPDDPSFGKLWGLRNTGSNEPNGSAGVEGADVNALKAWDITKGSRAVRIAVIDTGVDYTHPDLKANMWVNTKEIAGNGIDDDGNGFIDDVYGYDFANNDSNPMDGNGHGTHCSGTIGAVHDNKIGVSGVMSDVQIMAVKFLGDDGSGSLEGAIKAIDYATMMNVDLMSNSWGGGGRSEALLEAIKRASDKGIIFTAAAGNSSSNNDSSPSYPASYDTPNMVSVAATTAQNGLASFSSFGRNSVHIAAPGHNILSTVNGGGYDVYSGTSMATPHVSGVLGLLLAKEGRMPHSVMRERLTMTSVPVTALRGKTQTAGRIDAYNLLTDVRPERSGPKNDAWKKQALESSLESDHPYADNMNVAKTITIPGAKYIRVKVAKYDLEQGYDYLRIADGAGNTVEKVTGAGTNYTTDYIEGNTVTINFVTDRSMTKWGYLIQEIEVQ